MGNKINFLSVVVPVFNEEGNIAPLLKEIYTTFVGNINFEIIYVNDGSTDQTQNELIESKSVYSNLRILNHKASCGQSLAIRTGIIAAKGDWILTLDGDGQNDPSCVNQLFDLIENGVDLIGGNRTLSRQDSFSRRSTSLVANLIRSNLLKDSSPDSGCGLKLIRKSAFLDLPYFDHMHRFLPALIQRRGGKVISFPVNHRIRKYGKSKYGTIDRLLVGIVDLLGVLWLIKRSKIPIVLEG